jgi:hypothetical protein
VSEAIRVVLCVEEVVVNKEKGEGESVPAAVVMWWIVFRCGKTPDENQRGSCLPHVRVNDEDLCRSFLAHVRKPVVTPDLRCSVIYVEAHLCFGRRRSVVLTQKSLIM